MQIWPCRKKVKGQPTTLIWLELVELETAMLYTKIQPQSFLGSKKVFLPYMAANLFKGAEPFEQIGNTISTEGPISCEIWWKLPIVLSNTLSNWPISSSALSESNSATPFPPKNKLAIPFRLRAPSHVKSGDNCTRSFREEDNLTLHNFIHVYSPGANKGR